ncbi:MULTISPECIES: helix-turn-helix domain-containing protein [unclassified Microbacterium]|uniref:helix-turn-helix domain-containing protein n=1 Tax=unclassified Microbacterium TaxID=2609290 RepID=UPI001A7EAA46|nr:helix-turn-helix domain-containing protein [Microbacterium sp. CFBP 8801]
MRPPAAYIAPSGDVMVPPELARVLYEARGGLRGLRQMVGEGARPDLLALLEAIRYSGARWAGVDPGTSTPEPTPTDREWVSTREAATMIGISDSGVRKACREHRLAADASGGSWLIHREEIAHFRAARENR